MSYRQSLEERLERMLQEGMAADGQWWLWGTDVLSSHVHVEVTALDQLLGLDADGDEEGDVLPDLPIVESTVVSEFAAPTPLDAETADEPVALPGAPDAVDTAPPSPLESPPGPSVPQVPV